MIDASDRKMFDTVRGKAEESKVCLDTFWREITRIHPERCGVREYMALVNMTEKLVDSTRDLLVTTLNLLDWIERSSSPQDDFDVRAAGWIDED